MPAASSAKPAVSRPATTPERGMAIGFLFFMTLRSRSPLLAILSNGSVHGPQAVAGEARDRAGRAHARTRAETHSAANLCDSEPHLLRSGAQLHELA